MTPIRPQRPPYIDPRLDRWKVAGAVLLFGVLVGLRMLAGIPAASSPPETPDHADEASVPASGVTPAAPTEASALPTPGATAPQRVPFAATLLGSDKAGALANSRPVLVGQATPGQRVQIRLNNAIFTVTADPAGSWYFAAPQPLPVGMTWVLAHPLFDGSVAAPNTAAPTADPNAGAESLSLIAIIAANAKPLEPPRFDPISTGANATDSLVISGRGPAGTLLQVADEQNGRLLLLSQVRVRADGRWVWTPAEPLTPGVHRLVATVVEPDGTPLTRSRPATLQISPAGAVVSPPQIDPLPTLIPDFPGADRPHLFVLAGTAAPDARLFLYIDGQWLAGLRAGPDGVWRHALTPPLTLTTRQIQVIQVDEGGRPIAASLPTTLDAYPSASAASRP